MTTDKLFILLLVVLLPLTGCLDTVEPAGAESNDDTVETIVQTPDVQTLHLQPNTNSTIVFNGTTLKLENMYKLISDPECEINCSQNWTPVSGGIPISMSCGDGTFITTNIYSSWFLPIIGGTECEIIFNPDNNDGWNSILIFSTHSVASLDN
jgi:hypothetical protein